jgi:hypothetical protein
MKDGESLVNQTVVSAVKNRCPMEIDLPSNGWLVAHPQADFVLVTVGQRAGVDAIELLQRRWRYPERYGQWTPAALRDNELVAVMRLERHPNGAVELLDDATLDFARELLT